LNVIKNLLLIMPRFFCWWFSTRKYLNLQIGEVVFQSSHCDVDKSILSSNKKIEILTGTCSLQRVWTNFFHWNVNLHFPHFFPSHKKIKVFKEMEKIDKPQWNVFNQSKKDHFNWMVFTDEQNWKLNQKKAHDLEKFFFKFLFLSP
jgi:hypothetical protein